MRSHTEIYLHFVWGTWKRRRLLIGDRVAAVYAAIHRECVELGCDVIAIGGIEDHVHLFVRASTSVAPALIAKQAKGSSSHLVNPVHGRHADFRWQRGYGVFSVSRQHVARIRRYVLNQEAHHRSGRTAAFLEPVYDPSELPPAREPTPPSPRSGLRAVPAVGFQPAGSARTDDPPHPARTDGPAGSARTDHPPDSARTDGPAGSARADDPRGSARTGHPAGHARSAHPPRLGAGRRTSVPMVKRSP